LPRGLPQEQWLWVTSTSLLDGAQDQDLDMRVVEKRGERVFDFSGDSEEQARQVENANGWAKIGASPESDRPHEISLFLLMNHFRTESRRVGRKT